METAYLTAAVWLALAVFSTIIANRLRVSMALIEICAGIGAGAAATYYFGQGSLGEDLVWLKFLAGSGAILLTFLAGAELEHSVLRAKWREVLAVGFVGFLAPFAGCAAIAYFLLGWELPASLLAGVALSTTSMAVVYAVLFECGLNKTGYGKGILGACFINDLATVIVLGLLFAPFSCRTIVFVAVSIAVLAALPFTTATLTRLFGYRTAAIRTKWILAVLFGLGALALWAGSEAVLPAYLAGFVLSGVVSKDEFFMRRLRTLTIGLLTPFYFIRAGALVSAPAVIAAPVVFIALLAGKVVSKIFGLFPLIGRFREERRERWYYTLLMSTGLTFGTISALYGYSKGIVSQSQYSILVAVVIGSALIPTFIANAYFVPNHLLRQAPMPDEEVPQDELYRNNGGCVKPPAS